MRRIRWALVVAIGLAVLVTVPAFGGDTALKRVKKLERRVRALTVLEITSNTLTTRTVETPMTSRGDGYLVGTAFCGVAGKATGGGVVWKGGALGFNNRIYYSYAVDSLGWSAAVDASGSSATPYVQVVCTDLD